MILQTLNAELILPFGKILRTDEAETADTFVFVIRWSSKLATKPPTDWVETCGIFFKTEAIHFNSLHNSGPAMDGLSCSIALGTIPRNIEWARYLLTVFEPGLTPTSKHVTTT